MERFADLPQRFAAEIAEINGYLDRVRALRQVELGDLGPRAAKSPGNSPVPGTSCLAELLDPKTAPTFFKRLREHGFRRASEMLGTDEQTLRKALWSFVQSQISADDGVTLSWTNDGIDPASVIPEEISRISDLLHLYACECFLFVEQNDPTWHRGADPKNSVHPNITHIADLTDAYLAQAMACVATALDAAEHHAENGHWQVHLEEAASTFSGSVRLLLEAILDSTSEPDSDTPAPMKVFTLHPAAGGLIEMADQFSGTETSGPRPVHRQKLDIDRSGADISLDELANVYRVSPISVSNLLNRVTARINAKILCSEADREIFSSLDAKMLREVMGQALDSLETEKAKALPGA